MNYYTLHRERRVEDLTSFTQFSNIKDWWRRKGRKEKIESKNYIFSNLIYQKLLWEKKMNLVDESSLTCCLLYLCYKEWCYNYTFHTLYRPRLNHVNSYKYLRGWQGKTTILIIDSMVIIFCMIRKISNVECTKKKCIIHISLIQWALRTTFHQNLSEFELFGAWSFLAFQKIVIATSTVYFTTHIFLPKMSDSRENVILDTSMGSIHIELYWDHAPR